MARSGAGQQEPRQSGRRSTRWGFRDFASAVWGVALTVFAIGAALQVAKSFLDPGPARWLCDFGMIAAPLVGLAVAAYLFSIRERRRALTTVLVMSALFALALNGTDLVAWRWVRARAEVPDGLGAIVLSTRSLDPPSLLSMPWNDHMWQVEFRPARRARRTVRLPDLLSAEPEMSVFLTKAESGTALHLAPLTPEGKKDLYLDVRSGATVKAFAGTDVPVGRFYMDDRGKLQFSSSR
jgi:hypothetical protein